MGRRITSTEINSQTVCGHSFEIIRANPGDMIVVHIPQGLSEHLKKYVQSTFEQMELPIGCQVLLMPEGFDISLLDSNQKQELIDRLKS